ncbi:MAG: single-stranded DNA-binding protein [Candidatus Peribacteraceae bacterium]|nr:single-stranded DNA-binding protein [Candidatus Peribacteraceae bacterium]
MYSYNRVNIIGYQTQPIEVRQTPGGTSVTDLNLVVPYTFRSEQGEMLEGKGFHTVTAWGPMADIAGQFLSAGSQVFISGRLQTDSWEDQESGEKRSKTKIIALDMIMLDPRDGQMPALEGAKEISGAINRADVVGNITREPELRTTTSGQQVLTLGVATNDKWKDKATGEDKERAEFHDVVLWGKLAEEMSKHAKKGARVFASGRVQTRSWETQSGSKRYTTEIVAETVKLLGVSHPAAQGNISSQSASETKKAPVPAKEASPAPSSDKAVEAPVPEYASEVTVEDLPF